MFELLNPLCHLDAMRCCLDGDIPYMFDYWAVVHFFLLPRQPPRPMIFPCFALPDHCGMVLKKFSLALALTCVAIKRARTRCCVCRPFLLQRKGDGGEHREREKTHKHNWSLSDGWKDRKGTLKYVMGRLIEWIIQIDVPIDNVTIHVPIDRCTHTFTFS